MDNNTPFLIFKKKNYKKSFSKSAPIKTIKLKKAICTCKTKVKKHLL